MDKKEKGHRMRTFYLNFAPGAQHSNINKKPHKPTIQTRALQKSLLS